MKITQKLFFTLLAVSGLIIIANLSLARWSFHQGLNEFTAGIEVRRLSDLADILAEDYVIEGGNWLWLSDQKFISLQQQGLGEPRRRKRPLPEGREGGGFQDPRHPPPRNKGPRSGPPGKPFRARPVAPPTALFDVGGKFVIGHDGSDGLGQGISIPVILNGEEIASLTSWPKLKEPSLLESQFSRQQLFTSISIAILCLLLAAVVSWFTANRLLRPVRKVLDGVAKLTKGQFTVSFDEKRRDELGLLMSNIEVLSRTLEKNRTSKNRFFADVSHELRTPLTVLTGEVDVLKAGIRPFDQQQLVSFEQEIRRLNHLVDDLSQLSLSDVGGLRYSFAPHNLTQCVSAVISEVKNRANTKKIELEFSAKKAIWVNLDVQRFEQLLLNLCNNTLAYTDAPGKLVIAISKLNNKVELSFNDTPPGVSKEECQHLFEPLYRLDLSRTRRESGAGLGLTICKNIVEAHGGSISASPSKLGGLQILITLDALPGEEK